MGLPADRSVGQTLPAWIHSLDRMTGLVHSRLDESTPRRPIGRRVDWLQAAQRLLRAAAAAAAAGPSQQLSRF
jgi:hypothetical protein